MVEKTAELADNHIAQEPFCFDGASLPSPRADRHCMVTPIFAMQPNNDKTVEFNDGYGGTIKVTPAKEIGRATVEDRDILLFALSVMNYDGECNQEEWKQPRTIKFRLIDFFRFCGQEKSLGSKQIIGVEKALRRLHGTTIETNLKYNGKEIPGEFSLISDWSITKKEHRQRGRGHAVQVEIKLCRWLHNSVVPKREILTINPLYFRLPALQRRLYEIARKCVGINPQYSHPMSFYHDKFLAMIGTDRKKKNVLADLRVIQSTKPIPDFHFEVTTTSIRMMRKNPPKATSPDNQVQHDYSYDDAEPADESGQAIYDESPDDGNAFDMSHIEDLFPANRSDDLYKKLTAQTDFDLPDPEAY